LVNYKHRKIIGENLRFFLGDRLTEIERKKAAQKIYFRFLFYLFLTVRGKEDDILRLISKIRIENGEVLDAARAENRKIIMLTAHYGYWELVSQYICQRCGALVIIGEKLRNSRKLTEELKKFREQLGVEMLEKRGAMRAFAAALKNGKVVGLLTDQAVEEGALVKFFDVEITWLDSASRLAKQFGALIVPCYIGTEDYENYTIFFDNAIRPDESAEKEADIKRMAAEEALALERAILRDPSEYFWFHKRLKHNIKGFYK
jgi:KDO2-lipid IV(A) lauroyltransferase